MLRKWSIFSQKHLNCRCKWRVHTLRPGPVDVVRKKNLKRTPTSQKKTHQLHPPPSNPTFPSKISHPNSPFQIRLSTNLSANSDLLAQNSRQAKPWIHRFCWRNPSRRLTFCIESRHPFANLTTKKGANCSFSENRSVDVDVRFDVFFTGGWCVGEDFALGNWFNPKQNQAPVIWKGPRGVFQLPTSSCPYRVGWTGSSTSIQNFTDSRR